MTINYSLLMYGIIIITRGQDNTRATVRNSTQQVRYTRQGQFHLHYITIMEIIVSREVIDVGTVRGNALGEDNTTTSITSLLLLLL